jgi:acyl-CoA thioester hydrolase
MIKNLELASIVTLPCIYETVITNAYIDRMAHAGVVAYSTIFNAAAWAFFESIGLTDAIIRSNKVGTVALQHHVQYVAELSASDVVRVFVRVIAYNNKQVHYALVMVNETKREIAAIGEFLNIHVDYVSRRPSPFEEGVATRLAELGMQQQKLDWELPIAGCIAIRPSRRASLTEPKSGGLSSHGSQQP